MTFKDIQCTHIRTHSHTHTHARQPKGGRHTQACARRSCEMAVTCACEANGATLSTSFAASALALSLPLSERIARTTARRPTLSPTPDSDTSARAHCTLAITCSLEEALPPAARCLKCASPLVAAACASALNMPCRHVMQSFQGLLRCSLLACVRVCSCSHMRSRAVIKMPRT